MCSFEVVYRMNVCNALTHTKYVIIICHVIYSASAKTCNDTLIKDIKWLNNAFNSEMKFLTQKRKTEKLRLRGCKRLHMKPTDKATKQSTRIASHHRSHPHTFARLEYANCFTTLFRLLKPRKLFDCGELHCTIALCSSPILDYLIFAVISILHLSLFFICSHFKH